jgi:large subunit ribosomal protein L22
MELKHFTRDIRIAPRKLRLVTEQVKHMPASKAIGILPLVNKRGALHVHKSLKAAVEAAKDKNYNPETLIIQRISVDEGTALKRAVPHSHGSSWRMMKKFSHLNIVLTGEIQEAKKPAVRKVKAAATETVTEEQE